MAKKKEGYKKQWEKDDNVRLKEGAEWTKRVGVDFPVWMIAALDKEAGRIGVTRQSLIKLWISKNLDDGRVSETKTG